MRTRKWHWKDRQRHLARLGLATPEGYIRPNAPQYLRKMTFHGEIQSEIDKQSAKWFRSSGGFGICYRLRANTGLVLTEALWRRCDESREILEACILQAELHNRC